MKKAHMRLRLLLRPICWVRGHQGRLTRFVGWVSEDAVMPPGSRCDRCGAAPVPVRPLDDTSQKSIGLSKPGRIRRWWARVMQTPYLYDICERSGGHQWEYYEDPDHEYTGYLERCRVCEAIVQVPQ